jgi:hypothetical protein
MPTHLQGYVFAAASRFTVPGRPLRRLVLPLAAVLLEGTCGVARAGLTSGAEYDTLVGI